MNDISDLSRTIVAKADQLNSDELLSGPITVTIQEVKANDGEQPISLVIGEGMQPYKPCKTMRKILIYAWGKDGRSWVGRSMTLYNDPEVKYGGVKVGGIRISHLSHIDADMVIALTETKGKKKPHYIKILKSIIPVLEKAAQNGIEFYKQAFGSLSTSERVALGEKEHARLKQIAEKKDQENKG